MSESGESPPRGSIPVSSAHARALAAHFKTMEEYCRQMDRSLDPVEGIYFELVGDLAESTRLEIRRLLAGVFERLAVIRQDLRLERQPVSRRSLLEAYLAEFWVSLMETKSCYLRAYGEVPPELEDYLNPRLDEINGQVAQLRRLIGGISQDDSA